jgi:hypothetical protein
MQSNQDQNKVSEAFHERLGTRLLSLLRGKQEEKVVEKETGLVSPKEEEYSLEDVKSEMEIIENWVPEKEENLKSDVGLEAKKEKLSLGLAMKVWKLEQDLTRLLIWKETQKELNYLQLQMLERMSQGLMLVTAMACLSSLSVLGLWARG